MAIKATLKPIPRIKDHPLLGSFREFNSNRLALFRRVEQECGEIGSFGMGPFPATMLNSSELVQQVLVDQADAFSKNSPQYNAMRPVSGNGLLSSEGDYWKRQRKLMAPAFVPRRIAAYAETMVAYTAQMQAGWRQGETVDIHKEMIRLTMSIVGKTLFDAEVFSEADGLGAAFHTAAEYINQIGSNILSAPLAWPSERNRHTRAALHLIKSRVGGMIAERRNAPEEHGDLLAMLMAARDEQGQGMTEEGILDELITLFLAGHETTANSWAWAFYLLASNPAAYAKVQVEVGSVLAGRAATAADLPHLIYTTQVLKECLRLFPAAYIMTRVAIRDVNLGGYLIKQRFPVIISQYAIQRSARYFPDPDHFDPDRFTPAHEKRLPRHAWMPFGAGAHTCIGSHFALMEGLLILATLAQRCTLHLVPQQRILPQAGIAIFPKYGIRMWVENRV